MQAIRRCVPDVRVLCVLLAVVVLGDIATTFYGLSIGLTEQNTFVKTIIENYGLIGMVGLKAIVLSLGVAFWWYDRRYGKAALFGLAIPQGVAVVLNIVAILSH